MDLTQIQRKRRRETRYIMPNSVNASMKIVLAAITADIWKSRQTQTYIHITAQFVVSMKVLQLLVLETKTITFELKHIYDE